MRLLLLTLIAGCVPSTTTTIRTTDRQIGEISAARFATAITLDVAGDIAMITATTPRRCRADVTDTRDVHVVTTFDLPGTSHGDNWGYGLLVGFIVAYPIGIGAAVVSGVGYLVHPPGESSSKLTEVVGHLDLPCDLPAANQRLAIRFASGASIEAATDGSGRLVVVLPRAEIGKPLQVTALEDALPVAPPATVVPVTPPVPPPDLDEVPPAHDPALTNVTRTAGARARAGDCATVQRLGEIVRAREPQYYDRVYVKVTASCGRRSRRSD